MWACVYIVFWCFVIGVCCCLCCLVVNLVYSCGFCLNCVDSSCVSLHFVYFVFFGFFFLCVLQCCIFFFALVFLFFFFFSCFLSRCVMFVLGSLTAALAEFTFEPVESSLDCQSLSDRQEPGVLGVRPFDRSRIPVDALEIVKCNDPSSTRNSACWRDTMDHRAPIGTSRCGNE